MPAPTRCSRWRSSTSRARRARTPPASWSPGRTSGSRSSSPRLVTAGWKSPRNGPVLSSAIPERQTQADVVNSPRFVRYAHHRPTADRRRHRARPSRRVGRCHSPSRRIRRARHAGAPSPWWMPSSFGRCRLQTRTSWSSCGRRRRQQQPALEVSLPNSEDWCAEAGFVDMAAMGSTTWGEVEVQQDPPVRLTISAVSASLFDTLGVQAFVGRAFVPGEDEPEAPRVLVLSHATWRQYFDMDPDVVGSTVPVGARGEPFTVIGVMPPGFQVPVRRRDMDSDRPGAGRHSGRMRWTLACSAASRSSTSSAAWGRAARWLRAGGDGRQRAGTVGIAPLPVGYPARGHDATDGLRLRQRNATRAGSAADGFQVSRIAV